MSELPPGLEDFGLRLQEAAERDVAGRERRRERRRRRWRNLGLPVVAALVTAGVSASAVLVGDDGGGGETTPAAPGISSLGPAEDPAVVVASATEDPAGGLPWVVRTYTEASGRECVQVGRLREGVFGQVVHGSFRKLPASAPGTCATLNAARPLIASERRAAVDLTLVYGLAVDRQPVRVEVGDHVRTVRPAGFGAFVAVVPGGRPDESVVVRWKAGGRTHARRLG